MCFCFFLTAIQQGTPLATTEVTPRKTHRAANKLLIRPESRNPTHPPHPCGTPARHVPCPHAFPWLLRMAPGNCGWDCEPPESDARSAWSVLQKCCRLESNSQPPKFLFAGHLAKQMRALMSVPSFLPSFPSLPFPSLPFPSLPFPSLPSLPFPSLPLLGVLIWLFLDATW